MSKSSKARGARPSAANTHARKPNELFKPSAIIAALEASAGILSAAARIACCSRSTIRRYIDRYPEIALALAEIEDSRADIAETIIVRQMSDSSNPALQLKAAEFYLRTKGKKRGYTFSQEITGKDGGPIETARAVTLDLSGLSAEELAMLESAALIGIGKAPNSTTRH